MAIFPELSETNPESHDKHLRNIADINIKCVSEWLHVIQGSKHVLISMTTLWILVIYTFCPEAPEAVDGRNGVLTSVGVLETNQIHRYSFIFIFINFICPFYWIPRQRHLNICHLTTYMITSVSLHKTPLFKYTENLTTKNWRFSDKKKSEIFIFLLKT